MYSSTLFLFTDNDILVFDGLEITVSIDFISSDNWYLIIISKDISVVNSYYTWKSNLQY